MKKLFAIVLILTMVASLAACGSSGKKENSSSSDYEAEKVVVAVSREVSSCSPFTRGFLDDVIVSVYEYLGVLDVDGTLRLLMLKSIDKVDDVTYDCEIWDFIKDTNGNNIKASDVQFSINTRIEGGERIEKFDNLEVTGDYTFTIHLTEPFTIGEYEKMLSDPKIISQASYEADPDMFAAMAVATGPYKISELIIPDNFEPPVRRMRAIVPENESHHSGAESHPSHC